MSEKPTRNLLQQLTAAVLALPALNAQAQQTSGEQTFSYRYSQYGEDRLPDASFVDGDGDRYDIDIHQLRFATDLGDSASLTFDATRETMSGSTPWFLFPVADDDPALIMSGATIEEQRNEVITSLSVLDDQHRYGVTVGTSNEDDYQSWSLGFDHELTIAEGLRTVNWGVSFSDDRIEPTDAELFGRVNQASKHHKTFTLGGSQVINRDSVIQSGIQYKQQQGFLSDPYKMVVVGGIPEFDVRPDSRSQWTWTTRYRQYVASADAALHLDYRLYRDNWSITSHTVDIAWHQNLGERWQLVPALRYYSQSEAEFYAPVHLTQRDDGNHSADARLSGYGAVSGLLTLSKAWQHWKLTFGVEVYESDNSLGHDDSAFEHPGLVDFTRFTAGFDYSW